MEIQMDNREKIAVLEHMLKHTLKTKKQFTTKAQLRDQHGYSLAPIRDSMNRVFYNCVTGAILVSLNALGYLVEDGSKEHVEIAKELACTIGFYGTEGQKLFKLRSYNNEKGYDAIIDLIKKTIKRLDQVLQDAST